MRAAHRFGFLVFDFGLALLRLLYSFAVLQVETVADAMAHEAATPTPTSESDVKYWGNHFIRQLASL